MLLVTQSHTFADKTGLGSHQMYVLNSAEQSHINSVRFGQLGLDHNTWKALEGPASALQFFILQ